MLRILENVTIEELTSLEANSITLTSLDIRGERKYLGRLAGT
jgi:hypothetical protein